MPRLLPQIAAALGLLTRLPIRAAPQGPEAAWAWPLAGAVVGALAWAAAALALWAGLPATLAAGAALIASVMVTGAMHEDGLADTADGLWGGWTKARRLEIMKDSHIGTYGVMALLLVTLLRWQALALVLEGGAPLALFIAVGALSRVPMPALMAALPNARGSGLSQSVGRPSARTAALALALAMALALPGLGGTLLPALVLLGGVTLAVGALARARIGGQTGDILGASQQLAELALLALIA